MLAVTALSIVGVVLNNFRNRLCFPIWLVTNTIWAVYDWRIGAWEQSIIFVVYFFLAIWGWRNWSRSNG